MRNFGYVAAMPSEQDWTYGVPTKMEKIAYQENRDWSPYLPTLETQNAAGFETYGCVSFSYLNVIETMMRRKYGVKWNKSDRFLTVASGTIPGVGNSAMKVAMTARAKGLIDEADYPMVGTEKEYYQIIPEEKYNKVGLFLRYFELQTEWVGWAGCEPDRLWDALQYSPLQTSVWGWENNKKDGVYQRVWHSMQNHMVELYSGSYGRTWEIYDNYYDDYKTLAWDFYIGVALRHTIIPRMMKLIKSDKPAVYALDAYNQRHYIYNMMQLKTGAKLGLWDTEENIEVMAEKDLIAYQEAEPIMFGVI